MKKIAFIGPESTAKSSLCAELALHYTTNWIPEFARDYIAGLNRKYTEADVLHCIRTQIENIKKEESVDKELLLTDNEAINGMVWLLDKYNSCPEWIKDEIKNNHFDLYLLTYPDIDFIPDGVRENKDRRHYFYEWYKRELDFRKLNYVIIRGQGEVRFENTLKAVEKFLAKENQ